MIHKPTDSSDALELIKALINNGYDANEMWKMSIALAYRDSAKGGRWPRPPAAPGARARR